MSHWLIQYQPAREQTTNSPHLSACLGCASKCLGAPLVLARSTGMLLRQGLILLTWLKLNKHCKALHCFAC